MSSRVSKRHALPERVHARIRAARSAHERRRRIDCAYRTVELPGDRAHVLLSREAGEASAVVRERQEHAEARPCAFHGIRIDRRGQLSSCRRRADDTKCPAFVRQLSGSVSMALFWAGLSGLFSGSSLTHVPPSDCQ